jgi:hypothetical protein
MNPDEGIIVCMARTRQPSRTHRLPPTVEFEQVSLAWRESRVGPRSHGQRT